MGSERRHPLAEVTAELPGWARWLLHGILLGEPVTQARLQQHVVDADPPPELPEVLELDSSAPVMLSELRLGAGCYGLAADTVIEFGRRFTLIYGENGSGKSSLSRILRAMAGRPSVQRPPSNAFTRVAAEASITVERDDISEELRWRAGQTDPVLHVEVFDSADTRIDGTEYQVRPRSVLALEELRGAVDDVRFAVDAVDVPAVLRAALTPADLRALDDPVTATDLVEGWCVRGPSRPAAEVERDLTALGDEALARRLTSIAAEGRIARAENALLDAVSSAGVPPLSARLRAAASAELTLPVDGVPAGVDPDRWIEFLRGALPVLASSQRSCPLCRGDITDRQAGLVSMYQALLAVQRASSAEDAATAAAAMSTAVLTFDAASDHAVSSVRSLAAALVPALGSRDADRLDSVMSEMAAITAPVRSRLNRALADWSATNGTYKGAAHRREELDHELCQARRTEAIAANPVAAAELLEQLRRRARAVAAQQQIRGSKQRINTALRRHTEDLLEGPYGAALADRLRHFSVPHTDLLVARHKARGGLTTRHHGVGKVPTGVLFSEGEQRALALADFAAELDTRSTVQHPAVIDDPVSSLDYRRLESVVAYVEHLLAQDRQVVVLTHSLWLAAELMKRVKKDDHAWTLLRDELGTVAPMSANVIGQVENLEERIERALSDAACETDPGARHDRVSSGLSLMRSWCESYIEQKVLGNIVSRLHWQVTPGALMNLDERKLARGRAVATLYAKLHQRIDAHAQPIELGHRPDGLADFRALWAEAKAAKKL